MGLAWVPVWVAALGQGLKADTAPGWANEEERLGVGVSTAVGMAVGATGGAGDVRGGGSDSKSLVRVMAAPLVQAMAVVSGLDSALGSARVKAW